MPSMLSVVILTSSHSLQILLTRGMSRNLTVSRTSITLVQVRASSPDSIQSKIRTRELPETVGRQKLVLDLSLSLRTLLAVASYDYLGHVLDITILGHNGDVVELVCFRSGDETGQLTWQHRRHGLGKWGWKEVLWKMSTKRACWWSEWDKVFILLVSPIPSSLLLTRLSLIIIFHPLLAQSSKIPPV